MAETHTSSPAAIVAALDFDRPSVYALRRAAEIFRRSPAGELDLPHVIGSLGDGGQDRARARSYSYRQEWPYEVHDSDVIPTGVDLV